MKPTQKQPEPLKNVAAKREDFDPIKNAHGFGMGHICSCVDRSGELIDRLFTEREELKEALEAEKRRTAAFEQIAAERISEDLQNSEFTVYNERQAEALMKESRAIARAEAQKLLADSGGRNSQVLTVANRCVELLRARSQGKLSDDETMDLAADEAARAGFSHVPDSGSLEPK